MRLRAVVLCPLLTGLLLSAAGCSRGGATSRPEAPLAEGVAWERPDLRPVTRPVVVDDQVLLYALRDGTLRLTSLDGRSGKTRWEQDASVSGLPGGVALNIPVIAGTAFFLRAATGGSTAARLTAVVVATGEQRWSSDRAAAWDAIPAPCAKDTALCGSASAGTEPTLLRVDASDGRTTVTAGPTDEPDGQAAGRRLSEYLIDPGGRAPEEVARVTEEGAELWRRPVSELFGGLDVTSDSGWYFFESGELSVGQLGPKREFTDAVKLGGGAVAGFERDTGRARWAERGTDLCSGALDDLVGHADEGGSLVRCRPTGIVRLVDGEVEVNPAFSVTLEGYDPGTGRTTWSTALGRVPALAGGDPSPVLLDEDRVVLSTRDGKATSVHLRTGATQDVAGSTTGWCSSSEDFQLAGQLRFSERMLSPCRVDGAPGASLSGLDPHYGYQVAGLTVWAGPDGVAGARR